MRTTYVQESSYALPELARQLRPLWITPASARFPHFASDASFLPVICVSASRTVDVWTDRRTGGFAYVQGSGDDHESWAQVRYISPISGLPYTYNVAIAVLVGRTHLTGKRPYLHIAGPNATVILATSRRITGVLSRRARGGGRQASNIYARRGTEFRRRWILCSMEHTSDTRTKSWRPRAALRPGGPAKRPSGQPTWRMRARQR